MMMMKLIVLLHAVSPLDYSLTLRMHVRVVIEHVDFYDGTHTDCSQARARTSSHAQIKLGSICELHMLRG